MALLRTLLRSPRIPFIVATAAVLAGGGFGCQRGPRQAASGEITAAEKILAAAQVTNPLQQRHFGRTPTSETPPVCFKNRFSDVESMRREVAALENTVTGAPLSGSFLGMDLSRMPRAQGAYLLAHSRTMQVTNLDFSSCQDLICALGRIYPETSRRSPLLHYLFYLKTGYVISTQAETPDLNTNSLSLPPASFLFSEAELEKLVQVAFSAPLAVLRMAHVNTFHRVPRGYHLPDSEACADATHTAPEPGYIRFMDLCLQIPSPNARYAPTAFAGTILGATLHELSHFLDSKWGSSNGNSFTGHFFSERADWRNFSGWSLTEGIDAATRTPTQHAQSNSTTDGFVRDYASTHPREDFAETLAYVRYQAEDAFATSPRKSAFFTQRVFGGRRYTLEGLQAFYEAEASRRIQSQLATLAQTCVLTPADAVPVDFSPRFHFRFALPQNVMVCVENALDPRITAVLNQLRYEELEACEYMQTREADLRRQIIAAIEPALATLLEQNQQLAPLLRASQELRQQLATQVDARETLLSCWTNSTPQPCYEAALAQAFESIATPLATSVGSLLDAERRRFLDANAYEETRSRLLSLFRNLLSGVEPILEQAAINKWQQCRQVQSTPGAMILTPFSGGTRYIAGPILTCINATLASGIDDVLSRWLRRLGITVSGEQARGLMHDQLQSLYLSTINDEAARESAQEQTYRDSRRQALLPPIVTALSQNHAWADRESDAEAIRGICLTQAGPRVEAAINGEPAPDDTHPSLRRLRFIAAADLVLQWKQEACNQVLLTPEIRQQMETSLAQLWATSLERLEGIFNTRINVAITRCRNLYAGDSERARQNRSTCLTAYGVWRAMEAVALADWRQTRDGQRFLQRQEEAQRYMYSHQVLWQRQALRRMEGNSN